MPTIAEAYDLPTDQQPVRLVRNKFFLVDQWALTGYLFKIFMKRSKIIEAAFIAQALYTLFVLDK